MKSIIVKSEFNPPPQGNNFGINLMGDDYFNIPYIFELVPNYRVGNQLPDHTKKHFFIVEIYGEYPIMDKGDLKDIKLYQSNKVE